MNRIKEDLCAERWEARVDWCYQLSFNHIGGGFYYPDRVESGVYFFRRYAFGLAERAAHLQAMADIRELAEIHAADKAIVISGTEARIHRFVMEPGPKPEGFMGAVIDLTIECIPTTPLTQAECEALAEKDRRQRISEGRGFDV